MSAVAETRMNQELTKVGTSIRRISALMLGVGGLCFTINAAALAQPTAASTHAADREQGTAIAFMKLTITVLILALSGSALARQQSPSADASVAYPDGYRSWVHVKSAVVSPGHEQFASIGGFQHIYANAEAMTGYRTRTFPEGSIVVFDWLEMRDNNGAYEEAARRQVDVMVKDSQRFAKTGGWGFQRFVKDSKVERAATPTPQQCFACHEKRKKDGLILSSYRP